MAVRELLVMRHAKSDWDAGADSDFARPLSKRGRRDCERIAQWLGERSLFPDHILHSAAVRTTETTARVLETLGVRPSVDSSDGLYLGGLGILTGSLRNAPAAAERVLLVGHNPGMDELVTWLTGFAPPRAANGKLMVTAALAWFRFTGPWSGLSEGGPNLVDLVRPKEI